LFIFQAWIQTIIHPFQYFDELFAALAIPILIIKKVSSSKAEVKKYSFLLPVIAFLLAGVVSSFINNYQPLENVLSDMFANLKFWLAMYVGYSIFNNLDIKRYASRIYRHCMVITVFFITYLLLGIMYPEWFQISEGSRYGLPSIQLFYSHPNELTTNTILLLSLVTALSAFLSKGKLCIALLILLTVAGLRAVHIAVIAVYFALYVIIFIYRPKFSAKHIIILLPAILLLGWSQIEHYFIEISFSARNQLMIQSLNIARDYFPLGTGFATYGSAFSINPYSPVYYMYNLHVVYGLTESIFAYASDTFWPMILAQTGIIGLVSYVVLLFRFFKRVQMLAYVNKYYHFSAVFIFFFMIIYSIAQSSFVSFITVPLAVLSGVLLSQVNKVHTSSVEEVS
jgi:hypothetical protein